MTTAATTISAPAQNVPIHLSPGQSRSFPIAVARSSVPLIPLPISAVALPAPTEHPEHHPSNMTFNQILMGDPIQYQSYSFDQQQEGQGDVTAPSATSEYPKGSGSAGLPRMAINTDSIVKVPQPRRKSGRKKKSEVIEGNPSSPSAGNRTTERPTKKNTRIKKAQTGDATVGSAEVQPSDPANNGIHIDSMEPDLEPPGAKRKRRSSSRPRKSRKPSHPLFDPDADPGEELDPTVVTMAALCSDTGQGRVSSKAVQIQSNHAAWKASNREKRTRMKILMESKKYGKEGTEEVVAGAPSENVVAANLDEVVEPSNQSAGGSVRAPSTGPPPQDETGQGFDYSQSMSTSRFNVQVRIGPNGETIVDEESLFVDRIDENETINYTHVEESDTTKFVNSSTYGKKYRGSRWSAEETELFFDVRVLFDKCQVYSDILHTGTLPIWRELRINFLCSAWSRSEGL
jgi:transcription factor TFIIIB component B''